MKLLTHLRAYRARLRWRKALLLAYGDPRDLANDMMQHYFQGYSDGVAAAESIDEHPWDRLRKNLAQRFPQEERKVN